jgi:hypothetical protein
VRPNVAEALRGVQRSLASAPPPEVGRLFVEDAQRTSQMLLESVIGELEAGGGWAAADDATLRRLLAAGGEAVRGLDDALAGDVAGALAEPAKAASPAADNERLRGLLERLLVTCEDAAASGGGSPALAAVRRDTYRHLRDVAGRGWSIWDMLSFRERMAELRREER